MAGLRETIDSFVDIGLGYLSLDRASRHALGRRGAAHEDDPAPRLEPHRHHLRLRRADRRPAPARHPAHERAAPAAARQGQHRARRRAQARGHRDRRPRRRPRARARAAHGGEISSRGMSRACASSGTLTGRHLDHRAQLKPTTRDAEGAPRDPRRDPAQPEGRRRRHPARHPDGRHGGRRVGQVVAHPRQRPRVRRRRRGRPVAPIKGSRRSSPATYTGHARRDPRGVREGERGEARALQRELRGRVPRLQGPRRDHHELGFTQTVETLCELCDGTGFRDEVLEYLLDGKNIAEVLGDVGGRGGRVLRSEGPGARRCSPA